LKSLLSACPFEKDQNLVLITFTRAVQRSEEGESIVEALRSECGRTGMRHLAHLAGVLILTENKGAGWSRQLEDIKSAVEQELSIEAARWKPFGFLKKESRQ
jgi:hypothetical protein